MKVGTSPPGREATALLVGVEEYSLKGDDGAEDAFPNVGNFGFPDYLRRASIRMMLSP
jgi:hypothetical protein